MVQELNLKPGEKKPKNEGATPDFVGLDQKQSRLLCLNSASDVEVRGGVRVQGVGAEEGRAGGRRREGPEPAGTPDLSIPFCIVKCGTHTCVCKGLRI